MNSAVYDLAAVKSLAACSEVEMLLTLLLGFNSKFLVASELQPASAYQPFWRHPAGASSIRHGVFGDVLPLKSMHRRSVKDPFPACRCIRRAKGDQLQGDERLPLLLEVQDALWRSGKLVGRHRLTEIEDLAPVEWLARPV